MKLDKRIHVGTAKINKHCVALKPNTALFMVVDCIPQALNNTGPEIQPLFTCLISARRVLPFVVDAYFCFLPGAHVVKTLHSSCNLGILLLKVLLLRK